MYVICNHLLCGLDLKKCLRKNLADVFVLSTVSKCFVNDQVIWFFTGTIGMYYSELLGTITPSSNIFLMASSTPSLILYGTDSPNW